MMETNTEPLKTIRDFIRYCTTRLYSSEATFNHGYQNPEEEAAFLVLPHSVFRWNTKKKNLKRH